MGWIEMELDGCRSIGGASAEIDGADLPGQRGKKP